VLLWLLLLGVAEILLRRLHRMLELLLLQPRLLHEMFSLWRLGGGQWL